MKITKIIPQQLKNFGHQIESAIYNTIYNYPSKKLVIIGVTGTDGKTTTSTMIYEILKQAGKKVGMITTLKAQILDKEYPVGFHVTTPSTKLLQEFLKDMVNSQLEYVVLETTSHGLDQHRVGGIQYSAAVFTNITKEHLDYHKTYENYLKTKSRLILQTKKDGFCVLNKDDSSFEKLKEISVQRNIPVISYGFDQNAIIKAIEGEDTGEFQQEEKPKTTTASNNFIIDTEIYPDAKGKNVSLNLPGRYNISNALAAITVTLKLGIDMESIQTALENLPAPEGRWDVVQKRPFQVVVDFAHTPNALEEMLKFAKTRVGEKGKIIVVFGCAGLRDFYKRPMMGEIAGRLADIVIITAEDPRTEKIDEINKAIESGLLKNTGRKIDENYYIIPDRRDAIRKAIELAKRGDLVVTTGKGHEKSMNLDGKKELPWDEKKIVEKILGSKVLKM